MKQKGLPKPKTEMTYAAHSAINVSKFKIPDKVEFFSPHDSASAKQSFDEIGKFPELVKYDTLDKWKDKLLTGKLISINDKEITKFAN